MAMKETREEKLKVLKSMPQELQNKILQFAPRQEETQDTEEHKKSQYFIQNNAICRWKKSGEVEYPIPLCNFSALITGEVLKDNGLEQEFYFNIAGTALDGKPLREVLVPANKFSSMDWVLPAWGSRAVIYAGNNNKDHLRAAIQILSGEVKRHTIYTHLGWRKIDAKWYYLHCGGAIGQDGELRNIEVELDPALKDYELAMPVDEEELRKSIQASMEFLGLAKPEITFPLFAGIYLAPLGEMMTIDFSLFPVGKTGTKKSAVTAVALNHYGKNFSWDHLPASWRDTANILEKYEFLAKDALFVIDDFCPKGSAKDIQKLHKDADDIFRGVGNKRGRSRMKADSSTRAGFVPRCLTVSSGEDVPVGQSLTARMVIIEFQDGDVNLDVLTKMQQYARENVLTKAMAGYVRWLAPKVDDLKKTLQEKRESLRDELRKHGNISHDREPDNRAALLIGLSMFLEYAREIGAIEEDEAKAIYDYGCKAITRCGMNQAQYQRDEDPTERFISMLTAAISTGIAHIADASTGLQPADAEQWGWRTEDGTSWEPKGTLIGWIDDENNLLLEPETVYMIIQEMARKQNSSLPITQRTLLKRLREKGLTVCDPGRNDTRAYITGQRKRVVKILGNVLYPQNWANWSHRSHAQIECGLQGSNLGPVF